KHIVEYTAPLLPEEKPRYLMGLGKPEEIVMAVKAGIDMFDCVIPTREARHARLYFFCSARAKGAKLLFGTLAYRQSIITNKKFEADFSPVNKESRLPILQKTSRAYLRHLLAIDEGLGFRIATLNNVEFYLELMNKIRQAIIKEKI
ncbi:MAG TPA: tRNA-guanine transglycosylase, partial [Patescibacteria group bacterium]|nr:tRNA-guanine transglycosylase [Patescibacteria group bacterium]